MADKKYVLQRVEIVLYLLVDDGDSKAKQVTQWCERNGSSLADFAHNTDANAEQVAKDGWTDLDVYNGLGVKDGEDLPARYLDGPKEAKP